MTYGPTSHARDEWDDATATYRGYDADGILVEERPYTDTENQSADETANRDTLRTRASDALARNLADVAANQAFLAITSPTTGQAVAQVKTLSGQSSYQARELNALIRLVLNRLEDTT